ncbi:MAG: hypothetical protein L6R39_005315, partial [Caloplaca ligustica]
MHAVTTKGQTSLWPWQASRSGGDESSLRIIQSEPASSRPGQGSQPPPLSHSLLSQLELGENDPNTFREIVDDLTVQNKKLKRQLRRYERMHTNRLEHDGLLEVRTRNLSMERKQELEAILQKYASTIQPSQHKSVHTAEFYDGDKPTAFPSPCFKPQDSAYASGSTTGGTVKRTPARPGHFRNRTRGQEDTAAEHVLQATSYGTPQAACAPNVTWLSYRSKQEQVVRRLEELFLRDEVDDAALNAVNNRDADPRQLRGRLEGPESSNARPSPNSLRYLRHIGVVQPNAGSSLHLQDEWIYLNLVINIAQLHTLNVTPEFVRQAIRSISGRLVLSEDEQKVRWRAHVDPTAVSPDKPDYKPATGGAPQVASSRSTSSDQPQLEAGDARTSQTQALQQDWISGFEGVQTSKRAETLTALAPGKTPTSRPHYKPLFAHPKGPSKRSHHRSHDGSTDSSNAPSDIGEEGLDPTSGPLVFFDRSPFFLDLSADAMDVDRVTAASYASTTAEPLGGTKSSHGAHPVDEMKQVFASASASRGSSRNDKDSLSCPNQPLPLFIHDASPNAPDNASNQRRHIQLEASGIGSIQLDDNFAIDVET